VCPPARVAEIFAFVEAAISCGFRRALRDEPDRAKMLGSSISVISVGSALLCAPAAGGLLRSGLAAWSLGAFLATCAHLFVFGLELSIAAKPRPE
jgi:hypothetical protein